MIIVETAPENAYYSTRTLDKKNDTKAVKEMHKQ